MDINFSLGGSVKICTYLVGVARREEANRMHPKKISPIEFPSLEACLLWNSETHLRNYKLL